MYTYLWMLGVFALCLLLVVIDAQMHMRMKSSGSMAWLPIMIAVFDGGWFGKIMVDYWYTAYSAPPEIWKGALWIGAVIAGAIVLGGIIFLLTRFPEHDGQPSGC